MAEVKWIKIVTDIFDDEKILLIENMPDADTIIVIWFKLLCLAGKINNGGVFMLNEKIAYTDEMLATIFRRPVNTIRLAIKTFEQFGMVEVINDVITIPNWSKHQSLDQLKERKEYMRNYMREYREKQKALASGESVNKKVNKSVNSKANSKANVNLLEEDIDIDIDIEEDIKENKGKKAPYTKLDFAEFVKISPEEYEKLVERFGEKEAKERLINLNLYIGSTGKKYKSHYLTILNWDRMEKQRNRTDQKQSGNVFFEILKEEGET